MNSEIENLLKEKEKELENLEHPDCMGNWEESQGQQHEICKAEISILKQALEVIENQEAELMAKWRADVKETENRLKEYYSQQNPSQASEGVKIEASHNQHRTPEVVNVEEVREDIKLTSTNLSADIKLTSEDKK